MREKAQVEEIEIGPHFLTLYISSKEGNALAAAVELGEHLYKLFINSHPYLADIQQEDFLHERNDPNVYHPYGEPGELERPFFRHFHIRYGREPNLVDVSDVLTLLDKLHKNVSYKGYKLTRLESRKMEGKEDLVYPPVPSNQKDYLKYIEDIRENTIEGMD